MIQQHVKYDKRKLDALKKAAEEARSDLDDAKPAYRRAAVFLDRWVQMNFRTEGGNVGGWKPFKAGGRRVSRGGESYLDTSAKLLQDTGALRLSFRPFATKNNAGIGSDLSYAEIHEEGQGVPQRRMLPKQEEVKQNIRDILEQYTESNVLDNIRNAFR